MHRLGGSAAGEDGVVRAWEGRLREGKTGREGWGKREVGVDAQKFLGEVTNVELLV